MTPLQVMHSEVQAELEKAAEHRPSDLVLSSATTHPFCILPLVHQLFPTLQLQVRVPALTRISPDATARTPVILLGYSHLPPAQRQKMMCQSSPDSSWHHRTGTGTRLDGRDGHMLCHLSVDNKAKGKALLCPSARQGHQPQALAPSHSSSCRW